MSHAEDEHALAIDVALDHARSLTRGDALRLWGTAFYFGVAMSALLFVLSHPWVILVTLVFGALAQRRLRQNELIVFYKGELARVQEMPQPLAARIEDGYVFIGSEAVEPEQWAAFPISNREERALRTRMLPAARILKT